MKRGIDMRIAICDDEIEYLMFVKDCVSKIVYSINDDIFIDTYISSLELLKHFHDYEIIILDINMPDLNGIELSKKIREENEEVKIIFLTSMMQYVFESIKVTPFRYVMKNRIKENLSEAVLKAYEKILLKSNKTYTFTYKLKTYNIPINDILYFEFSNRFIYVHTEKTVCKFYGRLVELESQLKEYNFIRNHSAYLVNVKNVVSISKTQLILKNNEVLIISKNRYQELKELFLQLIREEVII
jgi:DNA-binding LytR/AlgR family response regulator